MRAGAPQHPGWTGALAGAASAGIAAFLYASHCPDNSPLFVATWYPIATLVCAGVGRCRRAAVSRLVEREVRLERPRRRYFFTNGSRIAFSWSRVSSPP